MIALSLTPEDLSLALLATQESAAAAKLAAIRLRGAGDRLAPAYEAKAARMESVADKLNDALLAR